MNLFRRTAGVERTTVDVYHASGHLGRAFSGLLNVSGDFPRRSALLLYSCSNCRRNLRNLHDRVAGMHACHIGRTAGDDRLHRERRSKRDRDANPHKLLAAAVAGLSLFVVLRIEEVGMVVLEA